MIVHESGGFTGPITLTAEGLPPGVHAAPTIVRGRQGAFVLWADEGAADWTGTIKLMATAQVEGRSAAPRGASVHARLERGQH